MAIRRNPFRPCLPSYLIPYFTHPPNFALRPPTGNPPTGNRHLCMEPPIISMQQVYPHLAYTPRYGNTPAPHLTNHAGFAEIHVITNWTVSQNAENIISNFNDRSFSTPHHLRINNTRFTKAALCGLGSAGCPRYRRNANNWHRRR